MKPYLLKLFSVIFLFIIVACGGDDDYSPTETETTDTENPTPPTNLRTSNKTDSSLQLNWDASTDNVGVVNYAVFQDGNLINNEVTGTSLPIQNLTAETEYSFSIIAFDAEGNESESSEILDTCTLAITLEYKTNLSDMGVFTGSLSDMAPAEGVQLYEINSTLFTDYAKKQRLVRLPNCETMEYRGDDLLPEFPDNTLIAKTFYYNKNDQNPGEGKLIIETRILLKINGNWQVGNYIWNEAQTEATYTENGSVKPISYINGDNETLNIDYEIPSKQDCFTCHNNDNTTLPVGMKLRSMNFTPSYTSQNQLAYLESIGMMEGVTSENISILPDWTDDATYDILERGRAYIDVNCAHCHQPGGAVTNFNLDFRLETPFDDTGIYANRGEIEARVQSTAPVYRMPQLGRTIVHEEAVAMLLEYLEAIEN
ncbi:fibronectin type III domain-containing protein [Marixanthomonas ophiurae]|uniref:Fibronectin type-III domain-containing protein n=1 Tax=Marixanthomonas ophiurae TaxID=387659 RepID=A0A3E1Q9D9_9FLAO|nr:fibronectin type III domain-containing protein [Marixanthomonas ophiurae]RFN58746.1 hypothetical protein DZ858_01300 [Marixanthomonas ophiurae]